MSITETSPLSSKIAGLTLSNFSMPQLWESSTDSHVLSPSIFSQYLEALTLLYFGSIVIRKVKIYASKFLTYVVIAYHTVRGKECLGRSFPQLLRKIFRQLLTGWNLSQTTMNQCLLMLVKLWILKLEWHSPGSKPNTSQVFSASHSQDWEWLHMDLARPLHLVSV